MSTTRLALAGPPPALLLALSLAACTTVPVEVQTETALSHRDPPRAWAFSPEVAAPELAPVRQAVAAELRARGWLEAPADQASALVRFDLRVGDTRTVLEDSPVDVAYDFLSLFDPGLDRPERTPVPVNVRSVRLSLRIEPALEAGPLLFQGVAEKDGQDLLATRSVAPLVRAVFTGFLGGGDGTRQEVVDERPVRAPAAPAQAGPLPPRAACPAGLPVTVAAGAPVRGIPHPSGPVRAVLGATEAGCAVAPPARGIARVTFASGGSGYVPQDAIAYHPGP